MQATLVDPRYVTTEIETPVYRVDFWDQNRASYENRIENAQSVVQVLDWAEAHRDGQYVVVWVEFSDKSGVGLQRLVGWEPTNPDAPSYKDPYFCQ